MDEGKVTEGRGESPHTAMVGEQRNCSGTVDGVTNATIRRENTYLRWN